MSENERELNQQTDERADNNHNDLDAATRYLCWFIHPSIPSDIQRAALSLKQP